MEESDIYATPETFEVFEDIDYVCPFCNLIVEIFNNDLQLSVDVHCELNVHQKAFDLFEENNNAQRELQQTQETFSRVEGKNISSRPTNEIHVTNDSSPISYRDVLSSNKNEQDSGQKSKILSKSRTVTSALIDNNYEHLKQIFSSNIPWTIEKNKEYITKKNETFFMCVLCNANLELKTTTKATIESFTQHLDSLRHKRKVENQPISNCTSPGDLHSETNVIRNNINFIEENNSQEHKFYKSGDVVNNFDNSTPKNKSNSSTASRKLSYSDVLCRKVSKENVNKVSDKTSTVQNLVKLKTNWQKHIQAENDYKYLSNIMNSIPKIIDQNKQFLTRINEKFFLCRLCYAQLEIKCNAEATIQSFAQHLNGLNHKLNVKTECKQTHLVSQPKASTFESTNVIQLFGTDVPEVLNRNKEFLILNSKRRIGCILCGYFISVLGDYRNGIRKIVSHLDNFSHQMRVNNARRDSGGVQSSNGVALSKSKSSSNKCLKSASKKSCITLNHNMFASTIKQTKINLDFKSTISSPRTKNITSTVTNKYLTNIFGPFVPDIVYRNKHVLSRCTTGCLCTLCHVLMQVPTVNSKNAIYNFSQHLLSHKHNENLKEMDTLSGVKSVNGCASVLSDESYQSSSSSGWIQV